MTEQLVHPLARCESASLGARSRVGAFAFVSADTQCGDECTVQEHATLRGTVRLGSRVTIEAGATIIGPAVLEDEASIGPGACIGAARGQAAAAPTAVKVGFGASIGANATLLAGISIGRFARVEPGAVVTADVPPFAVVQGVPAVIEGYRESEAASRTATIPLSPTGAAIHVKGVSWVKLPSFADLRGDLVVAEFGTDLPFVPQRSFLVHNVPSARIRGEHAHRECHQILLCVSGSVRVLTDDGQARQEFTLDSPSMGLHLNPLVWGSQYNYSAGAALLVFASHSYAAHDYIRTYDDFLAALRG